MMRISISEAWSIRDSHDRARQIAAQARTGGEHIRETLGALLDEINGERIDACRRSRSEATARMKAGSIGTNNNTKSKEFRV